MSVYTTEEKEHLDKRIKRKIRQFKEDILYLEEATKPIAPENAIGRVSRMDAINNKSVNVASLTKLRQSLKDYQEALKRLDEPSFGQCNRCREPISFQRILAMPNSKVCMTCLRR